MALRPTFNGVRRANPDKQAARSAVKTKPILAKNLTSRNPVHQIISAARSVPVQASQEQ